MAGYAPDSDDASREIPSPLQITRETNGVFEVENHFESTDARDCKFTWQLRNFTPPFLTNAPFVVLREGVLDSPAIPPGETGILGLGAVSSKSAEAVAVRVADPSGRELGTWVWPLRRSDTYRLTQEPALHHAVPAETNGVITITAGELVAAFSRDNGRLLGVRRGAQSFSLTNGPRLAVGGAALRQIHYDDDGPDAFVSAKFDGELKSIFWRVNGNGWINCDYTYAAAGTNDFSGVLFDYPEKLVTHKRWLGNGPEPVGKDQPRGATLGVWENDCPPAVADGRGRMKPEFKGLFTGVDWLQLDTAEGRITMLNLRAAPFVEVLTPDLPPVDLAAQAVAPLPPCGLGFFDAIPAWGRQSDEARLGGASGEPTAAPGEYTGSVSFYFGAWP
jgi:hypothetical protein